MIISIIGMPGAGKTTLAKNLATRFNLTHVSAGDVARKMAETDEEVKAALDAGKLAPRGKMNAAMAKIVDTSDAHRVVLDGYPRYPKQLAPLQRKSDSMFIILGCTEEDALGRLMARGRGDDQIAQIQQRLSTYWDETEPMFDSLLSTQRSTYIISGLNPTDQFHFAEGFLIRHDIYPHRPE